ncbi:MAG: ParB/RepB/Spo0J family partition protein [Gemmatimonadales bacterium]|nr:ParB/RepB/Spo0J family partition protein [Gemmatimonadota bacterium]MCL4214791.1 ParB/RepB/Spo0J family partition protein [Gemmatimonadales bacterium]
MTTDKGRRLGRGLEALLARAPTRLESAGQAASRDASGGAVSAVAEPESALRSIPLGLIRPNPLQPRKEFKPEDLADLESSLRTSGLLQPVTVRPAASGRGYELIAGERRFRAAQRLEWSEIPAIVKDVDDRMLLSLALVENLQRADLNPIEEAEGYEQLIKDFSLTQAEVAEIVGKDRSTVANMLRLLALPASVRRLVWDGKLTIGHARALLGAGDESAIAELAREVVAQGLSVREVERRVREAGRARPKKRGASPAKGGAETGSAEVRRIEDLLRKRLGTDARIAQMGGEKGELRVPFYSADDLERLLEIILGEDRSA